MPVQHALPSKKQPQVINVLVLFFNRSKNETSAKRFPLSVDVL